MGNRVSSPTSVAQSGTMRTRGTRYPMAFATWGTSGIPDVPVGGTACAWDRPVRTPAVAVKV